MKSKLQALSEALGRGEIELVLVQHGALWDLSAMHRNAGVLSTLIGGPSHHVLVNGQLADAPKSGMLRRAPW